MASRPIMSVGRPQVFSVSRFLIAPVDVSIAPGVVRCEWRLIATRLVLVHRDPEIGLRCARLMPPGVALRTTLELVGEQGERAHIAVWWGLDPIRTALAAAGFVVRDQRAWLLPTEGWPPASTRLQLRKR
jgi:hypothetical protein